MKPLFVLTIESFASRKSLIDILLAEGYIVASSNNEVAIYSKHEAKAEEKQTKKEPTIDSIFTQARGKTKTDAGQTHQDPFEWLGKGLMKDTPFDLKDFSTVASELFKALEPKKH